MLTYVDFSYGINNDTIGHTDGCMMFGWGLIHKKLSKQKLNTKIQRSSNLLKASNEIPFGIWLDIDMKHQWFILKQHQIVQDNMSTIKMDKDDLISCTVNSLHINTRYFFVQERVDKK